MKLAERLVEAWYAPRLKPVLLPLVPLALLFAGLSALRRVFYALRRPTQRLPVPVCVVGNLTVGGTGKTPLVLALAAALAARGWRPGLLTRGYGGSLNGPREVRPEAVVAEVGDEALLLAAAGHPVWAGANRAAAGAALLRAHPECNVLLADDGLQHLGLPRDAEVVVIDADRRLGNGWLLPAGPLRESAGRLAHDDIVVWHQSAGGSLPTEARLVMRLVGETFVQVVQPAHQVNAAAFRGKRVMAIAAIGHPQRFFASLAAMGLCFGTRHFPDHHIFESGELAFPEAEAILMTAKDAVKCRQFADPRLWYLPVRAILPEGLVEVIEEKLRGSQTARNPGLPGNQGTADLRQG